MARIKGGLNAKKRHNRNLRKAAITDATNVKNMKKILPYI